MTQSMQYHFFKGPEKEGAWKSLDAETMQKRINAPRIAFTTVLSVNQKPGFKGSVTDEAKYQGPFYIDIDSDNIGKAIKAAKKVLDKLIGNGVKEEMIQIFATGKRGFHFLIPMRHFADDKAVRKLPLTYSKMARAMKLPDPETDLTVYSHGRGRMWRVTNKKRIDNGAFKVQITAKQLREIDPVLYADYCSAPRELIIPHEGIEKSEWLEGLYKRCHAQALEATKPITVFVDPAVVEGLNGELPPCGQELLVGDNLDEDRGFNERSTQFGKMVAMFGEQQGPENLITQFSINVEGTSYNTPEKRKEHTMKAYRIASSSADYAWSCRSMLSILHDKDSPCLRCPVSFLLNQQDDLIAEAEEEKERQRDKRDEKKRESNRAKPNPSLLGRTVVPDTGTSDTGTSDPDRRRKPDGGNELLGNRKSNPVVNGTSTADAKGNGSVVRGPRVRLTNRTGGNDQSESGNSVSVPEHDSFDAAGEEQLGRVGTSVLETGRDESGVDVSGYEDRGITGRNFPDHEEPDFDGPEETISEAEEMEGAAAELSSGGSFDDGDPDDPESGSAEAGEEDEPDSTAANDEGLVALSHGYYFQAADGKLRKISNFILAFKSVILEHIANVGWDRRVAMTADVMVKNRRVGTVILDETAWNSKANFLSYFAGVANAGFYGKDDDVQRMKIVLMNRIEKQIENIRRAYSVGIHMHKIGDEYVITYVEPGWSIDNYGNENLYQLSGQISAAPSIRDESMPKDGGDPELTGALQSLFGISSEIKMAQIIGWFMACFLKQHVFAKYTQFPLLAFGGPAGSGKSNVATLVSCLHAIDYRGKSSSVSLPQATAFAVWKSIKDTMTCPRIMEEYNKSKLPRNFTAFGEVFKDCWNQFAVQRGALSNSKKQGDNQVGAHLQEFPLTAPVLIIAEQMVTMPALVERMIQVPFSKRDLDRIDYRGVDARKNFRDAVDHKDSMHRLAKAANMAALQLQPDQVGAMIAKYDKIVPMEMGDRPHFSFKVVLMGLDFLSAICKAYQLDCERDIERMRSSLLHMLKEDISGLAVMKQRTEVDIIIDKLATMAAMSDSTGALPWLVEHEHYLVDGEWLYIDGLVAHAQYRSFCARVEHSIAVIEDYGQFKSLLKSEAYCDSTTYIKDENFARGRPILRLNLEKMAEKGIEVSAFVVGG